MPDITMPDITKRDVKDGVHTVIDFGKYLGDTSQIQIGFIATLSALWQIRQFRKERHTGIVGIEGAVHGTNGWAWNNSDDPNKFDPLNTGPSTKITPSYTAAQYDKYGKKIGDTEGSLAIQKVIKDHGGRDAVNNMLLQEGKKLGYSYALQKPEEWATEIVRENEIFNRTHSFVQTSLIGRIVKAAKYAAIAIVLTRLVQYVYFKDFSLFGNKNKIKTDPEADRVPSGDGRRRIPDKARLEEKFKERKKENAPKSPYYEDREDTPTNDAIRYRQELERKKAEGEGTGRE